MRHGMMFGFGLGPERFFEKGDFKFIVLELLRDKPSHGYEIIRRLEERFQGQYAPSAGVVYPTLQMLEDLGYVSADQQDGKKVYSITAAGLGFLEEQQPAVEAMRARTHTHWEHEGHEELHALMHELRDIGHLLRHAARDASIEQVRRVREAVGRLRQEIESIVGAH
jgi:DNA-binding PadR family transcriptional regulator